MKYLSKYSTESYDTVDVRDFKYPFHIGQGYWICTVQVLFIYNLLTLTNNNRVFDTSYVHSVIYLCTLFA
jgi:hypothetical protein